MRPAVVRIKEFHHAERYLYVKLKHSLSKIKRCTDPEECCDRCGVSSLAVDDTFIGAEGLCVWALVVGAAAEVALDDTWDFILLG